MATGHAGEDTVTIDVAPLFDPGRGSREETDRAIVAALERHGSFVATGASPDLDRRADALFSFFAMADDVKASCATCQSRPGSPNIYRGFYPMPQGDAWTRRETFDIGPEPPMSSPGLPGAESFREANAWPGSEPWDGWRDAMESMLTGLRGVAMAILGSVSRGLGLPDALLLRPASGRNGTLRLLHSAVGRIADGDNVITTRHVDTGILSMIWHDRTGLQMQGPDGTWRDVPTVADGLSVHCGDLLETPSGGRLKATPHRVLGTGDTERCSMGYFLEPDFETLVAPPSGDPVTYARHLVNEFPDRFRRPAGSG